MSNFSELLSQLIRGREANVSQLARTCGIHPPTLHQYMNGKRAMHNEDELERLAAALQLSPSEYELLSESYAVLQLGPERAAERQKIKWLLQSLPEIERQCNDVAITPQFQPYELSGSFAVLHTEGDVQAALFALFSDALQRDEELAVMLPPENDLLHNLYLLLGHFPSKSVIRHIFCMESGRCTGRITNIERAYYVTQYSTSVARYVAKYYYGHPDEYFGETNLLPGLILSPRGALRVSADGRSAILCRDPEVIRCYFERFGRVEQLCRPLLSHQDTPLGIARQAERNCGDDRLRHAKLISGGLCASAFWSDEIIHEYLNPQIPQYDDVLRSLLNIFHMTRALKRSGRTTIILNSESVRSFAGSGRIPEYPDVFMIKPLSKAHRRYLLEGMLRACDEGWYQMVFLKNCVFPVKPHWDVGALDGKQFAVSVVMGAINRELYFNERGLCRAFEDYFDDLVSGKYAMTPEETNAAIRRIIDELL